MTGVFAITVLIHFSAAWIFLDHGDAWTYVLASDRLLRCQGSAWVEDGAYLPHQNLFRLVPSLSWVPRYGLGGLWMPGWHLPSILVHALNALLLVLLCLRFGLSQPVALLSGLLFGLSPMHPHVVSWIGGTYDIFAGAFMLGALLAFADRRLALGLLCTAGAMMSKEMGVFTGPLLGLYWLFFERSDGLRSGFRRLWPYALLATVIVGLRLLQIQYAGSIDEAGLPARSLGFDLSALFITGPSAVFAGLGATLRPLVPVSIEAFGLLFAGVLLAALALRDRLVWNPIVVFGISGAWLLLIPVLLMREEGVAMSAADILFNARYLYVSLLLVTPVLSLAILGTDARSKVARLVALGLVVGSLYSTGRDVVLLTQVEPSAEPLASALLDGELTRGSHVFLLTNVYEEGPFRLALSRWVHEHTGATVHWVQRGSWRSIERDPKRRSGLDFKDFYLEVEPEPFEPGAVLVDRGDRVLLLSHGGPAGGHRVVEVKSFASLGAAPKPGRTKKLELVWQPVSQPDERVVHTQQHIRPDGVVEFTTQGRVDRPGGRYHRPAVRSQSLWLSPQSVYAVRIRYTARGPGPKKGDRKYAWGYAELHWGSRGLQAQDSFVSFPVALSGQLTEVELPLWFDPAWTASNSVEWLGFHPLDDSGALTLHGIEVIHR